MNRASSDQRLHRTLAERCRTSRFHVTWPIRITGLERSGPSLAEWGDLRNLSSGGALVRMNRELAVGAQAEVLIKVPWRGDTWMKFLATVTRVERGRNRTRPEICNLPAPVFDQYQY
jgi:hypothetical protein